MYVYSNTITPHEMIVGLSDVADIAPSVCLSEPLETHTGRHFAYVHKVAIEGYGARHTRQRNFGADGLAATWMDWGWYIANLLTFDPDARVGIYDGLENFLERTNRDALQRLDGRDRSVRNFERDHAAIWAAGAESPFALLDRLVPRRRLAGWTVPRVEQFLATA